MIDRLKRLTIVTGHYGSGKTNLAVNLAVDLFRSGKKVVLVDLDIVNPYFRSADFKNQLTGMGIEMICPIYANTNLDIPALGADIYSVFREGDDRYVILDVGGDDAGAAALGRYAGMIQAEAFSLLYVVNRYRYLTQQPEDAVQILREIEATSRLPATGIVNNSNLGSQTTETDVKASLEYGEAVAKLAGVPLFANAVKRSLADNLAGGLVYPVDIFVVPPWEQPDLFSENV